MKILTFFVVLTAFATSAFAKEFKLKCKNEAHSPLVFTLAMDSVDAGLSFYLSDKKNINNIELDLNQKSAKLKRDLTYSTWDDYLNFNGQILVNKYLGDYRTLTMSVRENEFSKKSGIRISLLISSRTFKDDNGSYSTSFAMKCKEVNKDNL